MGWLLDLHFSTKLSISQVGCLFWQTFFIQSEQSSLLRPIIGHKVKMFYNIDTWLVTDLLTAVPENEDTWTDDEIEDFVCFK